MQGANSKQLYHAKTRGEHPGKLRCESLGPLMKAKMESVIQRACAPRVEDRYRSASEFKDALLQIEVNQRSRWASLPFIAAAAIFILGSFLALGVAEGLILLPVG